MWKPVRYLAAVAILLGGCRRSTSPAPALAVKLEPPAVATSSVTHEAPAKRTHASDDRRVTLGRRIHARRLQTRFQLDLGEPALIHAENQLRGALTQYSAANEETRTDIEEHISELADAGVAKRDIATTLGAMFAVEDSIVVKCSILNELYYLQDPSVLEQVTVGLSPNQPLDVRDEAISVLQDIGDKRAIPFLWPLLADPDENIREEARDAIDSLGNRLR